MPRILLWSLHIPLMSVKQRIGEALKIQCSESCDLTRKKKKLEEKEKESKN